MTDCIQAGFDSGSGFGKQIAVDLAGPTLTSDGGLLLKQTDTKLNLPRGSPTVFAMRAIRCASNTRSPNCCEDLNDHDRLRHDPLLGAVSGKADKQK